MKYFKYLWYIVRHKWYVFIECCKLGVPVRGLMHDLSKLRPSEFFPYADYFYGDYPEFQKSSPAIKWTHTGKTKESVLNDFNMAWLYHQHRNPHHWQYYIMREDSGASYAMEMPERVIREMVADWRGAGRAITGKDNTLEWYRRSMQLMLLHPKTRARVEDLIGYAKAEQEKADSEAVMDKLKEKIAQYKHKPVHFTDIETTKESNNG